MKREIDQIDRIVFSLFAEEHDMQDAENVVLGDWSNHRSSLDWEPFDEDDYKPDPCDRVISCRLNDERDNEVLADAFKIMAHLGPNKCHFRIDVSATAFVGHFYSNQNSEVTIFERVVAQALEKRIDDAVCMLTGREKHP